MIRPSFGGQPRIVTGSHGRKKRSMTVSAAIPPIEQKPHPTPFHWRKTARWGLGAYWLLMILATHWPVIPDLRRFHTTDKQVHFGSYSIFAAVLALACGPSLRYSTWRRYSRWLLLLAIPPLYGAIDELTQPWTGRACEWLDWVADCYGASTVMIAAILFSEVARAISGIPDKNETKA